MLLNRNKGKHIRPSITQASNRRRVVAEDVSNKQFLVARRLVYDVITNDSCWFLSGLIEKVTGFERIETQQMKQLYQ